MTDRTSASIEVAAPAADVMSVIADFEAYPGWADGITRAEPLGTDGSDAGGRADKVRFELDAGVFRDTYVLGYTWHDDQEVSWELVEQGAVLSGLSGAYRLTGGDDHTNVTYELAVDTKIPLPGLLKRRAEKKIIDAALKGLKRRVESGA